MEACLHHVPTNGNLLLIYCSHVGIDENGRTGFIERRGIKYPTTCCGAAIAAYNSNELHDSNESHDNYQIQYIINVVNKYKGKFTSDNEYNMILLPRIIRHQIHKDVMNLIPNNNTITIVLLGGININTKERDYFQVSEFSIFKRGKYINLIDKF